jgi:hypothetical protein
MCVGVILTVGVEGLALVGREKVREFCRYLAVLFLCVDLWWPQARRTLLHEVIEHGVAGR